jgi:hypothetical protein
MIEKPKATKRLVLEPMSLFRTIYIHCADKDVARWVMENVKDMGSLSNMGSGQFEFEPLAVYDRKGIIKYLESYNDDPAPTPGQPRSELVIRIGRKEYKLTFTHSVIE